MKRNSLCRKYGMGSTCGGGVSSSKARDVSASTCHVGGAQRASPRRNVEVGRISVRLMVENAAGCRRRPSDPGAHCSHCLGFRKSVLVLHDVKLDVGVSLVLLSRRWPRILLRSACWLGSEVPRLLFSEPTSLEFYCFSEDCARGGGG